MPEVILRHGPYYPDNEHISLSDIAATLVAHERLLPVVSDVLEAVVPGLTIDKSSIFLDQIVTSSLKEAFYVAMFVAFQKDLEREVPPLFHAITGQTLDPKYDTIATVLFLSALYTATSILFDKIKKKSPSPDDALERELAAYRVLAAEQLGVDPEAIREATLKSIQKRKASVIRAAIDLFRPAKRGRNGRIVPLGLPALSKEAVAAFPDAVALAEMDSSTVPIPVPEGRLIIRAMDRDRTDRGWHGKLAYEGHETKRLPIRLAPGVDPETLAGLGEATVQGLLEAEPQKDGDLKPVRIHIFQITDQSDH